MPQPQPALESLPVAVRGRSELASILLLEQLPVRVVTSVKWQLDVAHTPSALPRAAYQGLVMNPLG